MRISDWSSDVCSSDLAIARPPGRGRVHGGGRRPALLILLPRDHTEDARGPQHRHGDGGDQCPLRTRTHETDGIGRGSSGRISSATTGDRKSTRLNSSTNAHIVCRLLLETKKLQQIHKTSNITTPSRQ